MEGERRRGAPGGRGARLELVTAGSPSRDMRVAENPAATASPAVQFTVGLLAMVLSAGALVAGLAVHPLQFVDVVRAVSQALAIALPVLVGIYALRREQ